MRDIVHAMFPLRSLAIVSWWVFACLAFMPLSADIASAHAGHRHVIDAPAQSSSVSDVSRASVVVDATASDHSHDATTEPNEVIGHGVASTPEAMLVVTAQGPISSKFVPCTCGGACGSCTSMSCCSAVLVSTLEAHLRWSQGCAHWLTSSESMADTEIAPLPRPPNPFLLT